MIALGSTRVMVLAIFIRLCVCVLASTAYAAQPNIVVVLVDDMQLGLLSALPTVTGLARQGIRFDNARTQIALCSPSRSTILTRRYAQNTTVYTNSHGQFYLAGNPGRTIAVSLQGAGYRTGWIGKYINGYPSPEGLTYIPPGWSNWFGRIAESDGDVPYNYRLNQNGIITSYGATEADYATDVYFAKALSIIDGAVTAGAPFFVVVSVHAPHDPSTPAPRHVTLPAATMPTPPAFNEKDVSDKPLFIRTRKRFSSSVLSSARANYANRVRSLRGRRGNRRPPTKPCGA